MLDPDQPISISFVTDKTELPKLARHIHMRRLREFPLLQWPQFGAAWWIAHNVHYVSFLRSIPGWLVSLLWLAVAILLYALRTRRIVAESLAGQTDVRVVKVNEGTLYVEDAAGIVTSIPLGSIVVASASEGIYLTWSSGTVLVPARAFADSEEAGAIEAAYHRAAQAGKEIKIPASRIDGFPWSVTFQQEKGDAIHAYYHGWAPVFWRLGGWQSAIPIVAVLAVLTLTVAVFAHDAIIVMLMVVAALVSFFGIVTAIYCVTPSPAIIGMQRRHPIEQPLTVAVGMPGVAVNNGAATVVLAWSDIRKLRSDKRLIYCESATDLLLIPKSAFLDTTMADAFFKAVDSYRHGVEPPAALQPIVWPPAPESLSGKPWA